MSNALNSLYRGLLAHYRFNGDFAESLGNMAAGVLTHATGSNGFLDPGGLGPIPEDLFFFIANNVVGSGDSLHLPTPFYFRNDLPSSMCFWMRPRQLDFPNVGTTWQLGTAGSAGLFGFALEYSGVTFNIPTGKLRFRAVNTDVDAASPQTAAISNGAWNLVFLDFNPFDGPYGRASIQVERASVAYGGVVVQGAQRTATMRYSVSGGRVDGTFVPWADSSHIDHSAVDIKALSLYNRILRQSEREWLFNSGLGRLFSEYGNPGEILPNTAKPLTVARAGAARAGASRVAYVPVDTVGPNPSWTSVAPVSPTSPDSSDPSWTRVKD